MNNTVYTSTTSADLHRPRRNLIRTAYDNDKRKEEDTFFGGKGSGFIIIIFFYLERMWLGQ